MKDTHTKKYKTLKYIIKAHMNARILIHHAYALHGFIGSADPLLLCLPISAVIKFWVWKWVCFLFLLLSYFSYVCLFLSNSDMILSYFILFHFLSSEGQKSSESGWWKVGEELGRVETGKPIIWINYVRKICINKGRKSKGNLLI